MRLDKMRSLEELVDRSDTTTPESDNVSELGPPDSGENGMALLAPSQTNLATSAVERSLARRPSPCPSEASLISRESDYHIERSHGNYSSSRSGQGRKTLLQLVSYWAVLQELCDPSQQRALREDEQGITSREIAPRYGIRDIVRTREVQPGDERSIATPPSLYPPTDAKAAQPSPGPGTETGMQGVAPDDDVRPRLLHGPPNDGARGTLSPAQPHELQNKALDNNRPGPPPYPNTRVASNPSADRSVQHGVHHHPTAPMPIARQYSTCEDTHYRTHYPPTNHRHIEPLGLQRFSNSPTTSNRALSLFARSDTASGQYLNDGVDATRVRVADGFWNVLQTNGSVQWETRKKRKDKMLIKQYVGPVMCRQDEAVWSDLTFSGSAWTSLPRRFCSQRVLLGLPYEYQEDDQYFHIFEELDYVSRNFLSFICNMLTN
jgi:hypothetical protein